MQVKTVGVIKKDMNKNLSILALLMLCQLSIAQDKKVGIGTFTPEAQLHVKGKDTDSSTKNAIFENSAGEDLLIISNDGSIDLPKDPNVSAVGEYDILTRNKITQKLERVSAIISSGPEADPIWNQARVNTKTYKGNIPAGAQLDLYTETGIYNIENNTIAALVQNIPVKQEGTLEVFTYSTNTYQQYQTIGNLPAKSEGNNIYIRSKIGVGSFSPWEKLSKREATGFENLTPLSQPRWRLIGSNPLNYANAGAYSIDGSLSSAPGLNGATGYLSFALGLNNRVGGSFCAVYGNENTNNGTASLVGGIQNTETSNYSIISGSLNKNTGSGSIVLGSSNNNEAQDSAVFGQGNKTQGFNTFSSGNLNTVSGNSAATFGYKNFARGFGELSVGAYGTDYATETLDPNYPNLTDRVFNIGIGQGGAPKDALSVFRNGSIKLGVIPTIDTAITTGLGVDSNGNIKTYNRFESSSFQYLVNANKTTAYTSTGSINLGGVQPDGYQRLEFSSYDADWTDYVTWSVTRANGYRSDVVKGDSNTFINHDGNSINIGIVSTLGSNTLEFLASELRVEKTITGQQQFGNDFYKFKAGGNPYGSISAGVNTVNELFYKINSGLNKESQLFGDRFQFKDLLKNSTAIIKPNDDQANNTTLEYKLPNQSGELAIANPYKTLNVLLSQNGANNPTAISLQNEIGTFTLLRVGVGQYILKTTTNLTLGKLSFVMQATGTFRSTIWQNDANNLNIRIFDAMTGNPIDDALYNTPLELKFYQN